MENEVSLPLRFPEICVSCTILIICTPPDGRRAFRQITKRLRTALLDKEEGEEEGKRDTDAFTNQSPPPT